MNKWAKLAMAVLLFITVAALSVASLPALSATSFPELEQKKKRGVSSYKDSVTTRNWEKIDSLMNLIDSIESSPKGRMT